jgi:hypothetical protein
MRGTTVMLDGRGDTQMIRVEAAEPTFETYYIDNRHRTEATAPLSREPVADRFIVLGVRKSPTFVIEVKRYRAALPTCPFYGLCDGHSFAPVMIDHEQRVAVGCLIGIIAAIVVLDSLRDRVHDLPAIRTFAAIDYVPDHPRDLQCRWDDANAQSSSA